MQHIATQAFFSFPKDLQELSHIALRDNFSLAEKYRHPERIISRHPKVENTIAIPVSLGPCLKHYSIICQREDFSSFFTPVISKYIKEVKAPKICDLCERSQLALTAHHLVPCSVHEKALKQAWHEKQRLNEVAWLVEVAMYLCIGLRVRKCSVRITGVSNDC